jgi:GntR family negative regulator for fad regulon and positive regulator of fabA
LVPVLEAAIDVPDTAAQAAHADWELHKQLTIFSENPIFTMILNGFQVLYPLAAKMYYQTAERRIDTKRFYRSLLECVELEDSSRAEAIMAQGMQEAYDNWCTDIESLLIRESLSSLPNPIDG